MCGWKIYNKVGVVCQFLTFSVNVSVVPPRLLSRAKWTMTSLAGSEVTLPCEVTGEPWPMIRWSRDQLEIDLYSGDELHQSLMMTDTGSLVITSVDVDDAAKYQCVAENPAGVVSQLITLIVHGSLYVTLCIVHMIMPCLKLDIVSIGLSAGGGWRHVASLPTA